MAGFDFVIQIWTEDGVRVYQSRRYSSLPNQGVLGYSNVTLDNGDWRVFGVRNETRMIQVAQKLEARRSRAEELRRILLSVGKGDFFVQVEHGGDGILSGEGSNWRNDRQ